ncbi:hypothetical protein CK203_091379 [Vitis vinifera]|uniref:Uncharacterized protein n=1 Tax=Vitis vinifera TaxID=29760 RepID=A0A438CLY7_VITVI|nr:hypothetical protein CK203_091379 [Vitis vinifera]
MRNFSTKTHLFKLLNHLFYHYQQRQIPQPSGIIQIGVHQPPLHNNQVLPLRFLLMINANPNLIWVVIKHAVFKDTLPNDARCFGLSLINNPRHLVLKALRDITPTHLGNHEPIMFLYQGSNDIMINDGSTLPITHTGSTTIPTSSRTFTLQNVKDLNTRAILLMGEPEDGVYEW